MTDHKPPNDHDGQQGQGNWYERMWYQILLFAGGIALFGLVLGLILDWYIDPQTSTQKKDLVQALGLITAGVAGAVGIFFTWRGQRQAREAQQENQQNTQAQLKHTQEELRLTRQGQITERFTRAMDQLGAESLDIRLGGIYALERIAKESEEDYWPIMEVLTAYLREHARRPSATLPASTAALDKGSEQQTEEADGRTDAMTAERRAPPQPELPPPADIQAAIMALGRLSALREPDETVPPLDLHETNLSEGRLHKANLYRCNLWKANLYGANLAEANLYGANLEEADLSGVNLTGACLEGAIFRGANLKGADLKNANLKGANFCRAYLRGALLPNANLQGADLGEAFLKGAQIYEADLEKAKLQETNLQEAVLSGANLYKADLYKADLSQAKLFDSDFRYAQLYGAKLPLANLAGARLTNADLRNAYLGGADLSRTVLFGANLAGAEGLTPEQVQQAYRDDYTKLPESLGLPKSGSHGEDAPAGANE